MAVVQKTFVLTGAMAGQTITLGSKRQYPFVDGKMLCYDEMEVLDKVGHYIGRCWQAFPERSTELAEAQQRDKEAANGQRNLQAQATSGEGNPVSGGTSSSTARTPDRVTDVGGGDGAGETRDTELHPNGSGPSTEDIVKALWSLDPDNDEHWIADGRPRVEVVNQLLDSVEFGRTEMAAAVPDYTRDVRRGGGA